MDTATTLHIVVMGVSGCGKTTAAKALQGYLNCPYAEGDEFHTQANRDKMGAGIPLTDEDRWPWLERLRDWMSVQAAQGAKYAVVTCSALKRSYRDLLRGAEGKVVFVHLAPPADINLQRLSQRKGHYMKAGMLDSQLAILEPLQPDEQGIVIISTDSPDKIHQQIFAWLEQVGS